MKIWERRGEMYDKRLNLIFTYFIPLVLPWGSTRMFSKDVVEREGLKLHFFIFRYWLSSTVFVSSQLFEFFLSTNWKVICKGKVYESKITSFINVKTWCFQPSFLCISSLFLYGLDKHQNTYWTSLI